MAKMWSGFEPQNHAIRQGWNTMVEMQDGHTIVIDLETPDSDPHPRHSASHDDHPSETDTDDPDDSE